MKGKYYEENKSQIWSETDPFTIERYKQFANYIKEKSAVLDIGCNTGRGGEILKELLPTTKLYGIEFVLERVKRIKPGVYEEVFSESIITWEHTELKFDAIIAGEVIEHIPKHEFLIMLDRCKKLLNEKGLILFTTPNPCSFLVKLGKNAVFNDPSHVNIMSVKEFKSAVGQSGLKFIEIIGSGKVSRYIGSKIPIINLYGSYLAVLSK